MSFFFLDLQKKKKTQRKVLKLPKALQDSISFFFSVQGPAD